jgi:hypothetical protein
MGMFTDFLQNLLVDGLRRGGALTTAGAAGSSAVVKGIWTASTAYSVGDIVVPHANMTGAGGKFLRCTTAGTSGTTNTLAVPNPGSTLVDNTVTWTAVSGVPVPVTTYFGLLKCTKGARANSTAYSLNDTIAVLANDSKFHLYKCTTAGTTAASQSTLYPGAAGEAITDGTAVFTEQNAALDANSGINEVTGGSYGRASVAATLANWAGTQSSGSTSASTGSGGQSSNNGTIAFPTPTADWVSGTEKIWGWAEFDSLTGGNLLNWGPMTTLQSVLNGQAAPTYAAGSLIVTVGN